MTGLRRALVAAALASKLFATLGHTWAHIALFYFSRLRSMFLPKVLALASGSMTTAFTSWVRRQLELMRWRQRSFLHRLQVILLSVEPLPASQTDGTPPSLVEEYREDETKASLSGMKLCGRVEKRTLLEGSLLDTIMNGNQAAAALCSKAAVKCTSEKPFLTQHLDGEERYLVLNNALNLVSALTPVGHLASVIAPESTKGCWFIFALTVNSSIHQRIKRPDPPTHKIRIALVREDTLLWISQRSEEDLLAQDKRFHDTSPCHEARWKCLRAMASMYNKQRLFHDSSRQSPEDESTQILHLLRVHLSVSIHQTNHAPISKRHSMRDVLDTSQDQALSKSMMSPAMFAQRPAHRTACDDKNTD